MTLEIKNLGKSLGYSIVSVYIGTQDSRGVYQGRQANVYSQHFNDGWKSGETKKMKFRISSDQLQPNTYFLFVSVEELYTVTRTITQEINAIANSMMDEEKKTELILMLEKQRGITGENIVGNMEGGEVANAQTYKAIRVNPFLSTVVGLIIAIAGLVVAIIAL